MIMSKKQYSLIVGMLKGFDKDSLLLLKNKINLLLLQKYGLE